jgi:hypothetical protein
MNEQQTRELANQYRERAVIMEAAKWVDGLCVNVQVRPLHGDSQCWKHTDSPVWDFEYYEYRIVKPDEVRYYAWRDGTPYSAPTWKTIELARSYCRHANCDGILKVTTKPDGKKDAEFIEVGK